MKIIIILTLIKIIFYIINLNFIKIIDFFNIINIYILKNKYNNHIFLIFILNILCDLINNKNLGYSYLKFYLIQYIYNKIIINFLYKEYIFLIIYILLENILNTILYYDIYYINYYLLKNILYNSIFLFIIDLLN